jgi:hypothetical protein
MAMTTKPKTRKAPAKSAAAAPISSNHEMQDRAEILERLEAEDENASRIKHDAFMTMFAEWLKGRADTASPREDRTADEAEADTVRDEELARRITTTPVTMPYEIWHKFEVLEHYLSYYGQPTTWADNREVVMLAGIKADLLALLD